MTRGGFASALFLPLAVSAPFFAPSPSDAQSVPSCTLEWRLVPGDNQPGGSNGIGGLAVVNGTDIWAVGSAIDGDNRNTLIAHWNGTDWTVVESPNGPNEVNFLTRAAAVWTGDVWAVGYSRTPGFSGHQQDAHRALGRLRVDGRSEPEPAASGRLRVQQRALRDRRRRDDDIWAVGQTYDFTDGDSLVLHWDGRTGRSSTIRTRARGILYGVTAPATDDVWAVGNSYFNGLQQSVVEHWDGENWTVVPSPNVGPFLNWFLSISAASADGHLGGRPPPGRLRTSQVYQTSILHWDGEEWSVVPTPNQTQLNNYLFDVVGLSRPTPGRLASSTPARSSRR